MNKITEHILVIVISGAIFTTLGATLEHFDSLKRIEENKTSYFEQGYTKAYTDQFGIDLGTLFAKCKLEGSEPIVKQNKVLCVKEMKND